jgi:hypothetical protein
MDRRLWTTIVLLVGFARVAAGQDDAAAAPQVPPPSPWVFSGSLFVTDPPGSEARTTAVLQGKRGQLHLEMRYNYEDLDTASVFGGWTFAAGEEVALEFTPLIGLVGGETEGIAPGLELDLGWRRVAWYVEAEYLFDAEDSSDDFFYSWSTLTYGLTDWLDAGVVSERTKLVETDYEVQLGLALGLSFERFGLGVYSYNLGTNDAYTVLSLGGSL